MKWVFYSLCIIIFIFLVYKAYDYSIQLSTSIEIGLKHANYGKKMKAKMKPKTKGQVKGRVKTMSKDASNSGVRPKSKGTKKTKVKTQLHVSSKQTQLQRKLYITRITSVACGSRGSPIPFANNTHTVTPSSPARFHLARHHSTYPFIPLPHFLHFQCFIIFSSIMQ